MSGTDPKYKNISPFDLTSGDNPGAVISQPLLNGSNYDEWALNFRMAISSRKKFGFLNGTITKPAADSPEYEDWVANNHLIVGWIKLTIEPKIRSSISTQEVARDLWDIIKKRFSVKSGARLQQLRSALGSCKQDGSTIDEYFGRLTRLWDGITECMSSFSKRCECNKCDCNDSRDKEREILRTHDFLSGLDDVHNVIKSQICAITPLPDLDSVYQTILQNETLHQTQTQFNSTKEAALMSFASQMQLNSQYVAPQRVYTDTLMEEEKVATLGFSDQLPSPQGLFQSTPSPLFSVNQLSAALLNIGDLVVINQKLSGFGMHFPFQRVVPLAMDRAIKETVAGTVQRSVCIACQTTKELVLKDYALETDDSRIYNAAHLMVASLAGSLAHVTCKEPLRTSISGHLRNSLLSLNISNEYLEQIVQLVTNDNLDLGCAAIEQAATEKAIQTVDADIAQQLVVRRKRRDGSGSSFFDPHMLLQNSISLIPESLRPKPGHLSPSQQRVYEDFVQRPWQKQSTQTSQGLSAASSSSGDTGLGSGPGAGKVVCDVLSSAGNARMDTVSRPSEISVDGFESSVSVLSSQVSPAGDAASLQNFKPLPTSELNLADLSDAALKETGTAPETLTVAAPSKVQEA